jgi:hypothetical protein
MNKSEDLTGLSAIVKETAELRKIIDAPDKISAKQWMINFLNENAKKWRVEMGEDRIIYYLGDQWIFDLDLKNKHFWCYYYKVWEIFYKEYDMKYPDVQQLMRDVVLKPFNCEGFTPDKK